MFNSAAPGIAALLLGLGAAMLGTGAARADEIPHAEIVAFGIFGSSAEYGPLAPQYRQDATIEVIVAAQPRLLEPTDHIAARACLRFGLQYRATNFADKQTDLVGVRVEHPPLRQPDGRTSTADLYRIPIGNAVRFTGFDFDEPWELVPGTWSFSLVYGGRVLVEQRFTVTLAPGADAAGGKCNPVVS